MPWEGWGLKKLMLLLTALLMLLPGALAESDEIVSRFWPEDGEFLTFTGEDGLTVLQAHVLLEIGPEIANYLFFYAELRNDGAEPLFIDCQVTVRDVRGYEGDVEEYKEGDPNVLRPGGMAYYRASISLDGFCEDAGWAWDELTPDDLSGVTVRFFGGQEEWLDVPAVEYYGSWALRPATVTAMERTADDELWVTILNDTGEELEFPRLSMGVYDAQGRLLYVPWHLNGLQYEDDPPVPAGGTFTRDIDIGMSYIPENAEYRAFFYE